MYYLILSFSILIVGCAKQPKSIQQIQKETISSQSIDHKEVQVGLDVLLSERLDLIQGKSIGLVTNHSGLDHNGTPNYERLMGIENVNLKIIFSPEHGLFGEAAAGEKVKYNGQIKSLPPIVSLYGNNRKPSPEELDKLDAIIYDIQDIGARFYTYISTLGLVMEAAAESKVQVIVLDRPNPITGNNIEGPILNMDHQSFVGYYPIPIRYGLTVGELAKMIIGERWISVSPNLVVVPLKNWKRSLWLDETNISWVKPSPNIPDLETATIYPGMCLLEATNVNEGRGTKKPFKRFGAPWINKIFLVNALNEMDFPGVKFAPISYIPKDIPGMANNPKFEDQVCHGAEIILTDRDQYSTIKTGVQILSILEKLYPNQFEIKISGMNRLWGQSNFENIIRDQSSWNDTEKTLEFREISKKYYYYD